MAEAKARNLVYADQIELPIRPAVYPDELERWIELKDQARAVLRPLKLTDESLLRALFYRLSPESVHYRGRPQAARADQRALPGSALSGLKRDLEGVHALSPHRRGPARFSLQSSSSEPATGRVLYG